MYITRYVPPLSSATLVLPDSSSEIVLELQKQESLLAQIHSEMNAGFVSTKREEQLWEVQRLITQLKVDVTLFYSVVFCVFEFICNFISS